MSGHRILRTHQITPRQRGGGVTTIPLVNARIGSQQSLSGITAFPPGGSVPLHFHNCEETTIILEGSARAEIAGASHELSVGDVVWIPAGIHHRLINAAAEGTMRIYWTYASIDADRTIVVTGVTRRIDEEQDVAPL